MGEQTHMYEPAADCFHAPSKAKRKRKEWTQEVLGVSSEVAECPEADTGFIVREEADGRSRVARPPRHVAGFKRYL